MARNDARFPDVRVGDVLVSGPTAGFRNQRAPASTVRTIRGRRVSDVIRDRERGDFTPTNSPLVNPPNNQ